jgi:plastocyanin
MGKPAVNAVVWLDVPDAPRTKATIVLEQRNMTFSPRVVAAQVGTVIELPNNDRVFHNVFSFTDGKPFDLGLYPTGATKRITLDRPALSRLYCNIHPHMAAYIMAVATPHFAVSDQQGRFAMRSVPAGTYTYHAWRPGVQKLLDGTIAVDARSVMDVVWP